MLSHKQGVVVKCLYAEYRGDLFVFALSQEQGKYIFQRFLMVNCTIVNTNPQRCLLLWLGGIPVLLACPQVTPFWPS